MKVRWLWLPSVSGPFSADLFGDPGLLSLAKKIPAAFRLRGFRLPAGFPTSYGFPYLQGARVYRGCGGCDAERATADWAVFELGERNAMEHAGTWK